jgi:hypothetical protein
MKSYFLGKLSEINYRMAIHEGNANERLASQSVQLQLLPSYIIPEKLRKIFDQHIERIRHGTNYSHSGSSPAKIYHMYNKTAAKIIKDLITIEEELRSETKEPVSKKNRPAIYDRNVTETYSD